MIKITEIPLASLCFDTAASVRCDTDERTIERYAARWRDYRDALAEYAGPSEVEPEYPFPSIKVAVIENDDGELYDCISGQHRAKGAIRAKMKTIRAEVVTGTPGELLRMAIEENRSHGKALSKPGQRKCIIAAHAAFPNLGCRPLAEMVGCSKSLVNLVLNEGKNPKQSQRQSGKQKRRTTATDTEATDDTPVMTIPEFCEYVLDTIRGEADERDPATIKSLEGMALGIVKYLSAYQSIESLQERIMAVTSIE